MRPMDTNSWGSALRDARLAEGDTQERAGEKLRVDRSHVSHLESGAKKPSIDLALRAELVYHVPFRLLRSLLAEDRRTA